MKNHYNHLIFVRVVQKIKRWQFFRDGVYAKVLSTQESSSSKRRILLVICMDADHPRSLANTALSYQGR